MSEIIVNKLKKSVEEKLRNLQIEKYKIYNSLYEIHPNVLSRCGGVDFRVSEVEFILLSKETEKEFLEDEQYTICKREEEILSEENIKLLEEHYNEMAYDRDCYKVNLRNKVNKLRKLRLEDLDKLREIRNKEFSRRMENQYKFLKEQFLNYQYECYIDTEPRAYSTDFRRINNIKLIKIFKITLEEQEYLKSIISKEEINRRKNLKRREQRKNEHGRTNREEEKYQIECMIKNIINENPNIKKNKIANMLGLNKSSMSTTYKHLF